MAEELARREAGKARRASDLLTRAAERVHGQQIPRVQRRRLSPLHFAQAACDEFDEVGTPFAHTPHLASLTVQHPYLAAPIPQQPQVTATHLQFSRFVTHVTSTMHPHPRKRPNTIAIYPFDRCRTPHTSSPSPTKQDTLSAFILHLEMTACVTNDHWAWARFFLEFGSHSQWVGCMNHPLAVLVLEMVDF